jgi:hypothetical protein
VYVAKAQQPGRVREITVAAGATATVNVPWKIEGALRTGAGAVVLDVDKGLGGDAELVAATQLGRALGASNVVVLSTRPLNGRRSIVGYGISVESQNKAFAAIQIEPIAPTRDTVVKLAALLAGDKGVAAPGLITTEPVERPVGGLDRPTPGMGGKRVTSLVLGGVALASIAAAVVFKLSSDSEYDKSVAEPDDAKQKSLYDSSNGKYKLAQGFAIGGAALAIGAAVLWFTGGHAEHAEHADGVAIAPAPSPDGLSVVVSGRF